MANKISLPVIALFVLICNAACSQKENLLSVDEFEKQLSATPAAQLVDVRTSEEFAEGHLKNALSMNINSDDLKNRSKFLDKTKPVFVYCYSGGRSARASDFLRSEGFTSVFDLKGGYSAWTDLNKPVDGKTNGQGISISDFNKLITSGKVLVDINATWCAPCVKMKPILDELEVEWKGKVKILRFDKDKNSTLAQSFGIDELPTVLIFDNGKKIMQASGFQSKEQLIELVK